ncbi:MAG TPA: phytoene/squalene synthase family protein [Magnetospirillaceae bacterium]|jgi:phytoene synthase
MAAPELSPLAVEVHRHDRDRFVTTLFAPTECREALLALYAFNLEVARTRESVSEILLGEIRLQWWRDAIDKLYRGEDLAHPVVQGLGAAIRTHTLTREPFDRLIDARTADLSDGPLESLAGLESYAEGTSATLVSLALATLDGRDEAAARLSQLAGIGWGLVGLLRAVPFHARERRIYLPADLLAEYHLTFEDVVARKPSQGLARIAETIADRAWHHFAEARMMQNDLPRRARSALLIVQLGETYLARLRAARFDLTDLHWSAVRPPMLKLAFRSLTSGY